MRKCFLLLVLLFLSISENVHGFDITGLQPGSPYGVFSAFSAESLPKNKLSISAGAEISKSPDFYRFLFKSAYGITDTLELHMTIPYISQWANSVDGFEDIAFGIKHRFFDEGKYKPSLAYILNGSLSSGRKEFSTDGRYGAGIVISKRIGPFNGHANLFYEKPGDSKLKDEIILIPGFDFAAAHNFKILAELFMRKSHYSDKFDSIEGRVGYRIQTTDVIYTNFGIGFDLKNRKPEYRILFSVTYASPSGKKAIKKIYEEE